MTKRNYNEKDLYCYELFATSSSSIDDLNHRDDSKSSLTYYQMPLLPINNEYITERHKMFLTSIPKWITKTKATTCICAAITDLKKCTWTPDITFLNGNTLKNMKTSVKNDFTPLNLICVSRENHHILTQWMWEVVENLNHFTNTRYQSVFWISVVLMDKYFSTKKKKK